MLLVKINELAGYVLILSRNIASMYVALSVNVFLLLL